LSTAPTFVTLKHFLEFTKEKKLREPVLVARFGKNLLDNHSKLLGNEVWGVYERVCMAAVDGHDLDLADDCYKKLRKKFGKSARVTILEGMILEAKGEHAPAINLYDRILKDDATNQAAWKRKICVAREQGDTEKAIELLNKYLKLSSSEESSWLELADLYLSLSKLELAKFCLEELLLLNPDNYLYHLKYAEVVYTLGGKANVTLARQYYAQSLELKPHDNLRAQYGLIMCVRANGSKKLAEELHKWGGQEILRTYAQVSDPRAENNFENTQLKFNLGGDEISPASYKPTSRSPAPNANPFLVNIVHASLSI
jgi:tetratricopeptide (TPR) repeat protein